jgi:S-adenosylmethionine-diacylglycerol 3-amino-3-carboxypropyl transferase
LTQAGFTSLKAGLVDCIELHTSTVTDFLQAGSEPISRFVLLDHMDWMSSYYPAALIEEWQVIVDRAAPAARVLLRSAHARPPFLDWISVGSQKHSLHSIMSFEPALAERLHLEDRVHTYAGFVIAQFKPVANA